MSDVLLMAKFQELIYIPTISDNGMVLLDKNSAVRTTKEKHYHIVMTIIKYLKYSHQNSSLHEGILHDTR